MVVATVNTFLPKNMKSSIILLLLALSTCVLSVNNANAQIRTEGTKTEIDSVTGQTKTTSYVDLKKEEDITPRHNMIVVNPLKFFLFYNLSYYHAFSNTIAAGIGLQMPSLALSGFGVNAEVRFYPSEKALRGFYAAPNFSFNSLKYTGYYSDASSPTITVTTLGVLLGWQWFIGDDFAIGLGIGVDHYFGSSTQEIFSSYNGTFPALRFDIGYAWK